MSFKELNEIYKLIENLKLHGEENRREVFECRSYWSGNFGDRDQYSGEVYCADNLKLIKHLDNLNHIKPDNLNHIKTDNPNHIKTDNLNHIQHADNFEKNRKFQMIYMDPPFYSGAKYFSRKPDGSKNLAYVDIWNNGLCEYLEMLTERIFAAKELLSDDGLIWIHLDYRAVHYVKIIMDEIFGMENMVNEIVWGYRSGGASGRRFARKHDTILLYSKTKEYKFNPQKEKSYNRGALPYNFKGVQEYEDENGWYTLVNMRDVWEISMVGRTSGERTGYATQKPEELIRRMVLASTDVGDLCGDFFAGSGTLGAVCMVLERSFVLCDKNEDACRIMVDRLFKK